jgi:SAM-dependent methyltransferase
MHPTAMENCRAFFECYAKDFGEGPVQVIEIGSQNVNGTLRDVCPPSFNYVGVDFVAGEGVDLVLDDPYELPFRDGCADIVLSSSCFEHSEMFWLVYLEIMRVLKPNGLFYFNAPSNGSFHRYPVDCWRFYPDSGNALVTWGKRNGLNSAMLESYLSRQDGGIWNDFVAVFLKDAAYQANHPGRIVHTKQDVMNVLIDGSSEPQRLYELPEDKLKLYAITQIISGNLMVG